MKLASSHNLIVEVKELLHNARRQTVRQVNQTMVLTYFEIGRKIMEEEQVAKERAEYGKELLKELSKALTQDFAKGFSLRNLEQMRQFYLVYSKSLIEKTQTPSAQLAAPKGQTSPGKFKLSWSHHIHCSYYSSTS